MIALPRRILVGSAFLAVATLGACGSSSSESESSATGGKTTAVEEKVEAPTVPKIDLNGASVCEKLLTPEVAMAFDPTLTRDPVSTTLDCGYWHRGQSSPDFDAGSVRLTILDANQLDLLSQSADQALEARAEIELKTGSTVKEMPIGDKGNISWSSGDDTSDPGVSWVHGDLLLNLYTQNTGVNAAQLDRVIGLLKKYALQIDAQL